MLCYSDGATGRLQLVGTVLALSAIFVTTHCQTWRSAYASGGPSASFFSMCDECTLKKRSNYTGHCCCTPLLDIRCEQLSTIPEFSSDGPLTYSGIYMADQRIAEIPDKVFQNLKVRKIMLNFNQIEDKLSSTAFKGLEKTVQELYLGDCKITSLPERMLEKMEEMKYVHLWQNQIKRIPPYLFRDCVNLRELILWGNQIDKIDSHTFAGLSKLRKLDLDRNRIQTLSKDAFRHMRELEVLHIGENRIKLLQADSFVYIVNLKVLNLDGNIIDSVNGKAFAGLRSLVALALNGNKIRYFPTETFSNLTNLTSISLQNNAIESIWKSALQTLHHLYKVDLSGNRLRKIDEDTFSMAQKLRYLYLERNDLNFLNRCMLSKKTNLRTLSLIGNNFHCDCRASWLMEMHERDGVKIWGTCGSSKLVRVPTSIVSRFQYKANVCKNPPVECKL